MAGDLLLTGLSGLTAFRNALNTTGHNIANVTTEGYSRQIVELDAQNPQLTGGGYVGSGVQSTTVTRLYDSFLATQFRNSSSATLELDSFLNLATQVDGVLADQNVGLTAALQNFFNAVQTVADDPTSIPARQALLTEGEVIENRFNTLDSFFDDLTDQVNVKLKTTVFDINKLASNIASLNDKIVEATGIGAGNLPNDLLDQRDQLIDELSQKVNVSTSVQEDGSVNVFIGSGQSLVLGGTFNTLSLQQSGFDANSLDIIFNQPSGNLVVTQFMTGGEIGGTLRFRDEVLDPSINSLGQIAVAISLEINEQHTNGIDLNGAQGLSFFSAPQVDVISVSGAGSLGVTFANATNLTSSDYTLTTDGTNTNYTLTRLSDNTQFTGLVGAGSVTQDGLTFDLTSLAANDNYRVRPLRSAAADISLSIGDPREIAVALPVISSIPAANSGSGAIGNITIANLAAATLPADVTLTYDNTLQQYTVTGATGGPLAYDPATNNGSSYTVTVAGFGAISFTLTGQPADADTLVMVDNAGGIGDNRNANLLADLQTDLSMFGGTASFQDVYGQIVADVGRRTQSADANAVAQRGLLEQTVASKDSLSGVNLDEEAANLLRFQQAYQAASQVVLTSRAIFDTLLGAFR